MLICNGTRIDINTKSGVHLWVKKKMDQIVAEHKLHLGGVVSVVYSPTLIKTDKLTGKKKQPANILIDHFETYFNDDKDFVKEGNTPEMQQWRYCLNMTERGVGNKPSYYPSSTIITRSKNFTIKDLELIFFLRFISSRVENGGNLAPRVRKYVRFSDVKKETEDWLEAERTRSYINNCIIGDENTGGLTDEDIRNIAASFVIKDAKNPEFPVAILRKTIHEKIQVDRVAYSKILDLISNVKGASVKIMGDVADAKQLNLIGVRKIKNANHWVYLNADGSTGDKITKIPGGASSDDEFLKEYFIANPEDHTALIEAMVERKKADEEE